jgi:hypothetical protein
MMNSDIIVDSGTIIDSKNFIRIGGIVLTAKNESLHILLYSIISCGSTKFRQIRQAISI